ncbi:redox-sensing transcriptional repressor [Sporobacter termitidis DSM 10068]|uniref:Redox-sensing transcriptional repressor Rex n=1 Tax=Sporobacter termitidis DSM 10068 TaxID=1123282 RepID=A0A1M5YDG2_9FIRM|nr:redox-sensing transcriptional repressor Rex [Sporobacter termitidis]SHI10016.1 redox-sensing transcriptional repressor [Sporobacter termitidis DSM 10068]
MTELDKTYTAISVQALKRLPLYLNYLKSLDREKTKIISSPAIAKALGLNEVQVRKDLAAIKSGGRPRTGYLLEKLIGDLDTYLGYSNVNEAVLVGAGHLGRALISYQGFETYGLNIVVGFDVDETVVGTEICGKKVLPLEKLVSLCHRMHVNIGIIAVPAENAQEVCDLMVEAGILAIWNFAPAQLTVPAHILVQNENMASSLALLSKHLKKKMSKA